MSEWVREGEMTSGIDVYNISQPNLARARAAANTPSAFSFAISTADRPSCNLFIENKCQDNILTFKMDK